MLIERQLPVENNAKALDGVRQLNSSLRDLERCHVVDSILSATSHELNHFRLVWIQLQSILLRPRMNASDALLELSSFDRLPN